MKLMHPKTYWQFQERGETITEPIVLSDVVPIGEVVEDTDPRYVQQMQDRTMLMLSLQFERMCKDHDVAIEQLQLRMNERYYVHKE